MHRSTRPFRYSQAAHNQIRSNTWYPSGSYNSTACADGNFTLCYANLPPGTYYKVIAALPNSVGPYTLTVHAEACGTDAAVNDDRIGAIPLTAHATCEVAIFAPSCASQSLPGVS